MTVEELKSYLVDEAEYSQETVDHMSKSELLDSYLTYEGVRGFTGEILDIIEHLWNVQLLDCN